jgi:hypothetical protein
MDIYVINGIAADGKFWGTYAVCTTEELAVEKKTELLYNKEIGAVEIHLMDITEEPRWIITRLYLGNSK